MASKLVRATETLLAERECADERLFAGVGPDMARLQIFSVRYGSEGAPYTYLVLETTKGPSAGWVRAFVGPGGGLLLGARRRGRRGGLVQHRLGWPGEMVVVVGRDKEWRWRMDGEKVGPGVVSNKAGV